MRVGYEDDREEKICCDGGRHSEGADDDDHAGAGNSGLETREYALPSVTSIML